MYIFSIKAVGPVLYSKTCLYTMTKDRHFVVDTLASRGLPQILVCCGAGHVFKYTLIHMLSFLEDSYVLLFERLIYYNPSISSFYSHLVDIQLYLTQFPSALSTERPGGGGDGNFWITPWVGGRSTGRNSLR